MAIAFDNASMSTSDTVAATSKTHAHSCSGSDRFLVVSVVSLNGNSPTPTPTATYNGVSMTAVAVNIIAYTGTNNWRHHVFYLANPASGSNNVVVTATTGVAQWRVVAASYTGVDQTSPVITSNTAGNIASGKVMSISLTTSEDAWWYISGSNVDAEWNSISNNGSSLRNATGSSGRLRVGDSNGLISAQTGTITMSYTFGTSGRGYGGAAFAFKPAEVGPTPTPSGMMMWW